MLDSLYSSLLFLIGAGLVGYVIGLLLVRYARQWYKSLLKFLVRYGTWVSAQGAAVLGTVAIGSSMAGGYNPIMVGCLWVGTVGEIAASIYYGFGLDGRTPEERVAWVEDQDLTESWLYRLIWGEDSTDEEHEPQE